MKFTEERLLEILDSPVLDKKKKNFIFNCPQCGKHEAGISIELEGNPWQCYRKKNCGASGTIFTLLKLLGKLNLLGSLQVPQERKVVVKKIQMTSRDRGNTEESKEIDLPTISAPIGFTRIYEDEYLENRQFDQYKRYKVGFTKIDPSLRHGFLVFLIEQYGEIKGYIGRSKKDKEELDIINKVRKSQGLKPFLRYNNSSETDFSKLLFGYDEITEDTTTIILVEGIFDKFRVDKLLQLHEQEEIKCVCSFGCSLSDEQKYMLYIKNIQDLILLYDSDVTYKIKPLALELDQDFENVLVGYTGKKDPGEMELENLLEVIENLQKPSEFNLSKVHKKVLKV